MYYKAGESWTSCTATALDAQVKDREIFVRAAEDYLNIVTTATGGIVQTLVNGVIDELDDSNEAYVVDKTVDESLKTHLDDTKEPETAQESLEIVPESYAEVGSNQGNASVEGISCSSISVPFIQTVEESLKKEVDEKNEIRMTLESNGEFQDVPGDEVLIKELFCLLDSTICIMDVLASNWMNKPTSHAITNPCHCPKRCRNVMIALAIKDEVEDVEKAGVTVIQIDEAALRVGLPLRKAERAFYLDWVVHSFKATNVGVADTTQRKMMKCRSSEPWNEDSRDEDTILGTILVSYTMLTCQFHPFVLNGSFWYATLPLGGVERKVEQQQDKSSAKKSESMGTIDFGANVNQVRSESTPWGKDAMDEFSMLIPKSKISKSRGKRRLPKAKEKLFDNIQMLKLSLQNKSL
ncbi:cobalamine-independent methionine synthase [Artemisia annua]|uniref:Cobalamine-independent methionine synthase n=1 Tax=Artemisia annua TaxID=35608 RepID=A0A2U1N9B1_ARTAN|nr:cobalamine-independent methionine synthase [Artemisia annua]